MHGARTPPNHTPSRLYVSFITRTAFALRQDEEGLSHAKSYKYYKNLPNVSEQNKYVKVRYKSAVVHIVIYIYIISDHEQSCVLLLLNVYE
jgi:hypothetical protein